MLRGASHANKMLFETKSRKLKQAVNKQHPVSDEKRTAFPSASRSILIRQTDFTLTFPRNDKGSKIPKNNLISAAVVLL